MKIFKTEENPSVATTMYGIAQQLSQLGKYQDALEQYQKVLGKRNLGAFKETLSRFKFLLTTCGCGKS